MMRIEEPSGTISLALELTSGTGSVGLGCGGEWLGAEEVCKAARHHDDVMPAIGRLFERHGYEADQLGEIYVSVGPGGFTGIRLGVTTAKMLAFATGARIVAVPTVAVVAEGVAGPSDEAGGKMTLVVGLATKRGVSWCGVFDWDDEMRGWEARGEACLCSLAELVEDETGRLVVCCDLGGDEIAVIGRRSGEAVEVCPTVYGVRNCWEVGRRCVVKGRGETVYIEAADLLPCYGREPEAVRLWEARKVE